MQNKQVGQNKQEKLCEIIDENEISYMIFEGNYWDNEGLEENHTYKRFLEDDKVFEYRIIGEDISIGLLTHKDLSFDEATEIGIIALEKCPEDSEDGSLYIVGNMIIS